MSKVKEDLKGIIVPRGGEKSLNKQAVDTKVGLFGDVMSKTDTYNVNPDELVNRKGIGVYKQMIRDDQIKANSMLKKTSRLSTDNSIEDASNEEEAIKVGEFVRFALYEKMEITMRNLLLSLLSSMDFGYALAEKSFEYLSEGQWKGHVVYKNINPKDPEGFFFDRYNNGSMKPRGIIQNTTVLPWNLISKQERAKMPRFRTDKFVHFTHMSEFNNPYGQSDLQSGYRSWLSKDATMKSWMMYLERHGAPLPIGKLPDGALKEEKEEFQRVLSNLNTKSVITVPFEYEVSYLESIRTAAPGFEEAIAIHNGALDRSAMVPQLMGLSGGRGTGGSYGLGKTQYDVFIFYQEFMGLQLEDLFDRQIIKPLVDLNFSNVKDYPKFKFASIRRETRKDRTAIIQMLTQSGHIPDHQDWIWSFIDLPIPKSAIPDAGQPIELISAKSPEEDGDGKGIKKIDDNRDGRLKDPAERSVADGTNSHVDKTETESTNG